MKNIKNKALQREKKLKEILDKRVYMPLQLIRKQKPVYTPPANHPWRKAQVKEFKMKKIKLSKTEIKAQEEIEKIFGGLITFVH